MANKDDEDAPDALPDPAEGSEELDRLLAHARGVLSQIPTPSLDELKAFAENTLPEERREALKIYMRFYPDYYAVMDSYRQPLDPAVLASWRSKFAAFEAEQAAQSLASRSSTSQAPESFGQRLRAWLDPLFNPRWLPAAAMAVLVGVLLGPQLFRSPPPNGLDDRLLEGPGQTRSGGALRDGEPFLGLTADPHACERTLYFLWTSGSGAGVPSFEQLTCSPHTHRAGADSHRILSLTFAGAPQDPLPTPGQVQQALAPLLARDAFAADTAPEALLEQLQQALQKADLQAEQLRFSRVYRVEE